MKKNLNLIFLIVGFALSLSGCGNNNGSSVVGAGNPVAYEAGTGNCSSRFYSDYDSVRSDVESRNERAQERVQTFFDKYQGVICAVYSSRTSYQTGEATYINVNQKVSDWETELRTTVAYDNLNRRDGHHDKHHDDGGYHVDTDL